MIREFFSLVLMLSLVFQTPLAVARQKRPKPYPPITNIIYHSKNLGEFIEKIKTGLTEEQYKFLAQKAAELPPHEMPKVREKKTGSYEFKIQNVTATLKTVSAEKEIYLVNGKRLELAGLSLEDRLKQMSAAMTVQKSAASNVWNLLFPEANADITLTLAIIGTLLGMFGVTINLWDKSNSNCGEIAKVMEACIELGEKIQIKLEETANFVSTQKKIEAKGEEKSTEIAKGTQEACKDLRDRVPAMKVIDARAANAKTGITVRCDFAIDTVTKCQHGLKSKTDEIKSFVTKNCSPEATTTSKQVKEVAKETKEAKDARDPEVASAPETVEVTVPVIPDPMKKDAAPPPETTK